ncbi:serine/threonine protein kinase [Rhodococcus koreensis]
MRSPRRPATAPPPCGGDRVHGRRLLTADTHLTLQLVHITAYPCGLALQLALSATDRPARRAVHETRPLTDPADPSARWSYLDVWAGTDDLSVADPYFSRPDLHAATSGICTYRSEPLYWLPVPPPARTVTLTAGWPQIGLPVSVTTASLAPVAPRSTPRRT